jgi:cell division protein FtsQ
VVLLLALAGWGAWRVASAVGRAPVLQVSRITVTGNQRLSAGEVLALLDGLRGRNILTVKLDRWRERVLACPWVADAVLRRWLPSTIEVIVTERHPIAIGRLGEDLYLVDEHGGVIDEYGPRYADLDLPILDGLDAGRAESATVNERRAALAVRVLHAVRSRPDLAKRISQLDVSDPRNAVVIVDQDTARIRLGDDRFVERLQSYLELAPALRGQVPDIDYVDLRFGERVYVGAQAGVGAPGARRTKPPAPH